MSKSTKKAFNTCIFLYFCLNQDNLNVNSMFSISLLFYESGTYGSEWLKIIQINAENVVTRYDPHSNPEGGGNDPHSTLKSWQVCFDPFNATLCK